MLSSEIMIAVFKGKVLHNNPTRHHKTIAKKCKVIDRWWRQFDLISFELNTETFSGMPAKTFQFQFQVDIFKVCTAYGEL